MKRGSLISSMQHRNAASQKFAARQCAHVACREGGAGEDHSKGWARQVSPSRAPNGAEAPCSSPRAHAQLTLWARHSERHHLNQSQGGVGNGVANEPTSPVQAAPGGENGDSRRQCPGEGWGLPRSFPARLAC